MLFLFSVWFAAVSVVASYLIILGFKEYVPSLLRIAVPLLFALGAAVTAAPVVLVHMRASYELLSDTVQSIPPETIGVVGFGHLVLAVTLGRRWVRSHLRPNPEAQERDRIRGRERTRVPPRGEA